MMGGRGRYGKYGETKRFSRLRKAGPKRSYLTRSVDNDYGRYTDRRHKPYYKPFVKDKIKIRPAQKNDVEFIRSLSKEVFGLYGPYDETLSRWFLSDVTVTMLGTMGKRPVGFAMMARSFHDNPASRIYELLAIAVETESQSHGIGSLLLKEIAQQAETLQAETLVLHTATDNKAAQRLFKKNGFIKLKTKNCFYPKGQDAVMMVRYLN